MNESEEHLFLREIHLNGNLPNLREDFLSGKRTNLIALQYPKFCGYFFKERVEE